VTVAEEGAGVSREARGDVSGQEPSIHRILAAALHQVLKVVHPQVKKRQ